MDGPEHPAPVLGAGLGFVLAGTALFLQELGLLVVSWALVLPAILVVVGMVVALAGFVGVSRVRRS